MKILGRLFLLGIMGCVIGYLVIGVVTYKPQPTFLTVYPYTTFDGYLPNDPGTNPVKPGAYSGFSRGVIKSGGIVLRHPTMS